MERRFCRSERMFIAGAIHPVNPGHDQVRGFPGSLRIADILAKVGTAVIPLPAEGGLSAIP